MSIYKERLALLKKELQKVKAEAFLCGQPVNIRYLTGFSGSAGWLLLSGDKIRLYVDSRYWEQAHKEAGNLCRIERWKGATEKLWEQIRKDVRTKSLAIEAEGLSLSQFIKLEKYVYGKRFVKTNALVKKLRSVKDPGEIRLIKKAVEIAQEAFRNILPLIRPGIREREIALELEYHLRKAGAEKSAFDIIVLSGENSSLPHGRPSDKKIIHNTFILIDFGAIYGGYHSDLTRIVALGRMPARFKSLFDIVLEAKELGIKAIRTGRLGRTVDLAAREFIGSRGMEKYFGHGLGHGLGLEIHEYPVLSPVSEDYLVPGMVVTVEPGIYRPGLGGIRIEEDCLVTQEGCTVLTQPQKRVIEL